jgi:vacuolar protein-sorting-associated protein 4
VCKKKFIYLYSYSGADINIVVRDALMQPIRRLQSAYFFKTIIVNNEEKYIYCTQNDKGARPMKLMDVPKNQLYTPPVTFVCIFKKINKFFFFNF